MLGNDGNNSDHLPLDGPSFSFIQSPHEESRVLRAVPFRMGAFQFLSGELRNVSPRCSVAAKLQLQLFNT